MTINLFLLNFSYRCWHALISFAVIVVVVSVVYSALTIRQFKFEFIFEFRKAMALFLIYYMFASASTPFACETNEQTATKCTSSTLQLLLKKICHCDARELSIIFFPPLVVCIFVFDALFSFVFNANRLRCCVRSRFRFGYRVVNRTHNTWSCVCAVRKIFFSPLAFFCFLILENETANSLSGCFVYKLMRFMFAFAWGFFNSSPKRYTRTHDRIASDFYFRLNVFSLLLFSFSSHQRQDGKNSVLRWIHLVPSLGFLLCQA